MIIREVRKCQVYFNSANASNPSLGSVHETFTVNQPIFPTQSNAEYRIVHKVIHLLSLCNVVLFRHEQKVVDPISTQQGKAAGNISSEIQLEVVVAADYEH